MRYEPAGSDRFNFAFCMVLIVTLVVIPTIYPTGQVLLLPSAFFLLKRFPNVWAEGRNLRLAYVAVFSLIGWQWVNSSALMLAALAIPLTTIRKLWIVPVSPLLLVPPAMLVLFAIVAPSVLHREQGWLDADIADA